MPGLLDLNPTHVKSQTCRHIEFICDRLQHPPAQRSTGVLASIYRESCCTVCSTLACAVTQPFSMQCIRSCDHQGTLVHLFVACIIVFVPSAQDMKQCSLEFSARTAFDFVPWSDCSFACETGPPSQLPCVRQCRQLVFASSCPVSILCCILGTVCLKPMLIWSSSLSAANSSLTWT